jgi:hypothetical protein
MSRLLGKRFFCLSGGESALPVLQEKTGRHEVIAAQRRRLVD